MKYHIENGNIAILDLVKNEIMYGSDGLSSWFTNINYGLYIKRSEPAILLAYKDILQELQSNKCYKSSALKEWANGKIADPWIIAAAVAHKLRIVTFETSNKNLNQTNPSRRAKIPDVAKTFNVDCCTLFDMMRVLGLKA